MEANNSGGQAVGVRCVLCGLRRSAHGAARRVFNAAGVCSRCQRTYALDVRQYSAGEYYSNVFAYHVAQSALIRSIVTLHQYYDYSKYLREFPRTLEADYFTPKAAAYDEYTQLDVAVSNIQYYFNPFYHNIYDQYTSKNTPFPKAIMEILK